MARTDLITGLDPGPVGPDGRARQDYFETSLTQNFELGAAMRIADGRAFRYARAGAVALVTGQLQQSAVFGGSSATVQTDIAVQAAGAIGDTSVFVTLATDAATINQYAGGWWIVSDAAGQGQMMRIVGNSVATGGGTCRVDLERPLTIAITTSSKVQMMTSPYNLCITAPATTATGLTLGVSMSAVPINYYCWLQTWGMCGCLIKTALTMGTHIIYDVAAASSIGVGDGAVINSIIGMAGLVTATTDSGLVYLTIAP